MADGKKIDHITKEGFVTTSSTDVEVVSIPMPDADSQFHVKGWVTAVDGDELNPLEIFGTNCHTWLRSDLGITLDGSGNVSTWADQSGNGNDFSQSTPGSRPIYNTSDPNWGGLPSLTFDGSVRLLASTGDTSTYNFLHDGTGGCAIAVYRAKSGTNDFQAVFGNGCNASTDIGSRVHVANSGDTGGFQICTTTARILNVAFTEETDTNKWVLVAFEDNRPGNEYVLQVDGAVVSSGNVGSTPSVSNATTVMYVGSSQNLTGNTLDGEILEVIFLDAYPTATKVFELERYLRARYVSNPKDILGDNLKLWLRSDKGVELDSDGNVKKWNDISGNEHHFSQKIAADRPTYNDFDTGDWTKYGDAGPSDYYPSISFGLDGYVTNLISDDVSTEWNFLHDGTGGGMAFVYSVDNLDIERRLFSTGWGSTVNSVAARIVSGPNFSYLVGSTTAAATIVSASASTSLNAAQFAMFFYEEGRAGNEYSASVNGGTATTGNSTGNPGSGAPLDTAHIGSSHAETLFFAGEIIEIIAFDVYPSATQIERLNEYFNRRYFDGYDEFYAGPAFTQEVEAIGYTEPYPYTPDLIFGNNLYTWLRSDMGVSLNGTAVTAWADQSGNGRNFSQGTAANQPTYIASDITNWNGLPSISFDGNNDYLDSDDAASVWRLLHDGYGSGIFVVYRQTGTDDSQGLFNTGATGTQTGMRVLSEQAGSNQLQYWITSSGGTVFFNNISGTVSGKQWALFAYEEGRAANMEYFVYRNNVRYANGAGTNPDLDTDPTTTLRISATSGGGNALEGEIVEIVITDIFPTAEQVIRFNEYYNHRYVNSGTKQVVLVDRPKTPKQILGDNLHSWFRSDIGVSYSSVNVVFGWQDQSGNGHHLVEYSAGPTYVASDSNWNGYPSISFDGINDHIDSEEAASTWNFLHDGTGCSVIVVYRTTGVTNDDQYLWATGAGSTAEIGARCVAGVTSADQMRFSVANGSAYLFNDSSITEGNGTIHWVMQSYLEGRSGNEYGAYKDSTTASASGNSAAAPTTSDATSTLRIGCSATATTPMQGEIVEIIIANAYITDQQIADIKEYIDDRYINFTRTQTTSVVFNAIDPETSGFDAYLDALGSNIRLMASSNNTNKTTFYGRLEVDIIEKEQVTPATILGNNLQLWLRSDAGVSVVNGGVSTWKDQSGNNRNFSQSTASSRPVYNLSDSNWNDLPSLSFLGGDFLTSDDASSVWKFLHDGTGGGCVAVFRLAAAPNSFNNIFSTRVNIADIGYSLYTDSATNNRAYSSIANSIINIVSDGGSNNTIPKGSSAWVLTAYEEGRAGNEYLFNTNNLDTKTGNSGGNPSASNPTYTAQIGSNGNSSSGVSFIGDILEIITFSEYPTANQITQLENYLNNRYNLWDPISVFGDGLELWLRSDMGITRNGSLVTTWEDQSGNGRTFSQATAANQPSYVESDPNWGGLPSISFNPSKNNNLVSEDAASTWTYLHDGSGCCTIIVFRQQTTGLEQRIWNTHWTLGPAATGSCLRNTGATTPTFFYIVGSGANVISHSEVRTYDSNFYILTTYENGRAGNEYAVIINDESDGGNDLSAPTSSAPEYTLRIGTTPGSTAPFSGEILEFISVSRYPTSSELTRIQSYLDNRYGFNEPAAIFGSELELWLRSDYGVVTEPNTNKVSQWRDKSGKGRHFSQSTSANRPTINEKDKNWGTSSLTFNGSSGYLQSEDVASTWNFLHNGTGGTFIAIFRCSATASDRDVIASTGSHIASAVGFQAWGSDDSSVGRFQVNNGSAWIVNPPFSESLNINRWMLGSYEEGRAGNEYILVVDGSTISTGNSSAAPSASDAFATMRIGVGQNSTYFAGELVEIIAVSRYPTTNEQTQIAEYINNRYGI